MKRWCVYMLRCADGSLYTGATNDLDKRLASHAAGRGAAYTRARLPIALAWTEEADDRGAALRREAAIKRLSRQEKLALASSGGSPACGHEAGAAEASERHTLWRAAGERTQ